MLSPRLTFLLSCWVASVTCANFTTASDPDNTSTVLHSIMLEALRVGWTTTETFVRAFLLGFGGAILKDLLIDRKSKAETEADYASTFSFARMTGLGSGCFIVGASILVPADWRSAFLTRTLPGMS